MSRNADQFEQTQDYKNFIDIHGDGTAQETLLAKFNKNGIVILLTLLLLIYSYHIMLAFAFLLHFILNSTLKQ